MWPSSEIAHYRFAPRNRDAIRRVKLVLLATVVAAAIAVATGLGFAPIATAIVAVAAVYTLSLYRFIRSDTRVRRFLYVTWFVFIIHPLFITRQSAFQGGTLNILSGSVLSEVSVWVLCAAGLGLVLATSPRRIRVLWSSWARWLTVYAIIAIGSLAYSSQPLLTLAWGGKLVVSVLLLALIGLEMNSIEEIDSFLLVNYGALLLAQIVVWFSLLFYPETAISGGRLGGDVESPTGLAAIAAITAVASLARTSLTRMRGQGVFYLLAFVLSFITLATSQGKAGIGAGVIAIGIVLLRGRKSIAWIVLGVGVLASLLISVVTGFDLIEAFTSYAASGRAVQLTGRIPLWFLAVERIAQQPILGYGFAAPRAILAETGLPWEPSHAHNAFLQVLLSVGLLGFVPFLAVLVGAVRRLREIIARVEEHVGDSRRRWLAIELQGVFLVLAIEGLFRSSFGGEPRGTAITYFAIVVVIDRLAAQIRTPLTSAATTPGKRT